MIGQHLGTFGGGKIPSYGERIKSSKPSMTSERKSGRAGALADAEEVRTWRKPTGTKKGKGKESWTARRKIVKALMMIWKQRK